MTMPDGAPGLPDEPSGSHAKGAGWRRGRILQTGVIMVGAIALLALLGQRLYAARQVAGAQAPTTHTAQTPHPAAPTVAPDFTLHTWDWWSQSRSAASDPAAQHLVALRGQPVVINFWASWCDACRAEAPTLEGAWREYQARGVVFLGVDVNDTASDSASFLKQYGITYINGPDMTETIDVNYGVFGLPTTVFVNRNGDIQSTHVGEISASALDQGIQALLR